MCISGDEFMNEKSRTFLKKKVHTFLKIHTFIISKGKFFYKGFFLSMATLFVKLR